MPKRIAVLFLLFMASSYIEAKDVAMKNSKEAVFAIKHYDFFSYMNSKPTPKSWEFDLTINQVDEKIWKACYTTELTKCLFQLNDFRQENIHINDNKGLCFLYELSHENQIQVKEKKEIITYLKELKRYKPNTIKKKKLKEIMESVQFLLKYKDELDKDLTRELKLIHELENKNIPMQANGMFDSNEDIDFELLKKDEIEFLEKTNWQEINSFYLYRTLSKNTAEFLFDFMFVTNPYTAKENVSLSKIANDYFQGKLKVDDYDNITLQMDQRQLTKKEKKLNYLLQQRRTVTPKMKKITSLKITRK